MEKGGFPKYLQTPSVRYLSSLYESIIFRNVMSRNGLTNKKEIQEPVFYLASNATKRITYSSLGKIVGIRYAETIKNYLESFRLRCSGIGNSMDRYGSTPPAHAAMYKILIDLFVNS